MCCYFGEYTKLDFSYFGKYLAVRVRGYYDPQESDGRYDLFTPIYMRSIFVIDMDTKEKVFEYVYPHKPERHYDLNLAVTSFSPDDRMILTGALGGSVKLFEIESGQELASFENLECIADSRAIDDRKLAVFLNSERLF